MRGFNADSKKLLTELKAVKRVVRHYYDNVPVHDLWTNILRHRRQEFPNLCLLLDVLLSIAVSNSFVESTFSFLTAMLSDRRLSLNHDTMANLLILRAKHLVWTDVERENLIDSALHSFMQTRRKLKLASSDKTPLDVSAEPPAKFIGLAATVVADEEESSTSVDTSDSDSYADDVHHGSKSDTESELLPSGDESIKS